MNRKGAMLLAVLAWMSLAPLARAAAQVLPEAGNAAARALRQGSLRLARAAPGASTLSAQRTVLQTTLAVTVVGGEASGAQAALESIFAEAHRIQSVVSLRRPDSELSSFNARAGSGWVPVSQDLGEALRLGRRLHEETLGAFDATLGPVVLGELVHGGPLEPNDQRRTLEWVGGRGLLATRTHGRLQRAGMAADLGGIAQGLVLEGALQGGRGRGIEALFADFAGTSFAGFGSRPWPVALRNRDGGAAGSVPLRDQFLSLSASGHRGATVLDPRTGRPVRDRRLAAVRSSQGWRAEGWSMALVVMGRVGLGLVPRGLWVRYEDSDGVVVVDRDGDR